eukprot:Rhum_TRINITY_DN11888_c0_g2::Rhum_TRINITY_DN11888_c0_g2_i1::g.47657::m.47657
MVVLHGCQQGTRPLHRRQLPRTQRQQRAHRLRVSVLRRSVDRRRPVADLRVLLTVRHSLLTVAAAAGSAAHTLQASVELARRHHVVEVRSVARDHLHDLVQSPLRRQVQRGRVLHHQHRQVARPRAGRGVREARCVRGHRAGNPEVDTPPQKGVDGPRLVGVRRRVQRRAARLRLPRQDVGTALAQRQHRLVPAHLRCEVQRGVARERVPLVDHLLVRRRLHAAVAALGLCVGQDRTDAVDAADGRRHHQRRGTGVPDEGGERAVCEENCHGLRLTRDRRCVESGIAVCLLLLVHVDGVLLCQQRLHEACVAGGRSEEQARPARLHRRHHCERGEEAPRVDDAGLARPVVVPRLLRAQRDVLHLPHLLRIDEPGLVALDQHLPPLRHVLVHVRRARERVVARLRGHGDAERRRAASGPSGHRQVHLAVRRHAAVGAAVAGGIVGEVEAP